MKIKNLLSKLLLLSAFCFLLSALEAHAGLLGWIDKNPDAVAATNFTFALAPSHAGGLKDAHGTPQEWGVSAALLYPLNSDPNMQVFTGVRADYLGGSFFTPSINVQLNAPRRFFGRVNATPFIVTGVAIPVKGSASNGELVGIVGAGLAVELLHWKNGHLSAFYEEEYWSKPLDVTVEHLGLIANWHF